MVRLWIRSEEWLAIKGNEVSAMAYQVGARFKALTKGILVVPSKMTEKFFPISSFPAGLCTVTPIQDHDCQMIAIRTQLFVNWS